MTDWSHSHTLCTVLAQQLWSVSETSHKSLLKLCSNWRIYFSSSYQFIFPLRRIFPFMKRIPTWNASVYFLSDCDLLRRQENTLKDLQNRKASNALRGMALSSPYLVKSEPQKQRSPSVANGYWSRAHCSTQHDDERKGSQSVPMEYIPNFLLPFLTDFLVVKKPFKYSTCYLVIYLHQENYLFGHSLH